MWYSINYIYILYFGTATVVIGGTSETTTENTYSVCTLDSSFPTTVVGCDCPAM